MLSEQHQAGIAAFTAMQNNQTPGVYRLDTRVFPLEKPVSDAANAEQDKSAENGYAKEQILARLRTTQLEMTRIAMLPGMSAETSKLLIALREQIHQSEIGLYRRELGDVLPDREHV